ncbi:MAG: hypothetical protein ACI30K_05805 [Muribaculaceae bacterium]
MNKDKTSKLLFLAVTVIATLMSACSSDDTPKWQELSISDAGIILREGEAASVSFTGGSSDYSVTITNPDVATCEIETSEYAVRFDKQLIHITPVQVGNTVVSIVDNVNGSSITLTVRVVEPYIIGRTPTGSSNYTNEVFKMGTCLCLMKSGKFMLFEDPYPTYSSTDLKGCEPILKGEYAMESDASGSFITFAYIESSHMTSYKFKLNDEAYKFLSDWPAISYGFEDFTSFLINMTSIYDQTRALYLAEAYTKLPYGITLQEQ